MIVMDLSDREVHLLMTALGKHISTLEQHPSASAPQLTELITELFELETDLREAFHRRDDGWNDAAGGAASHFIQEERWEEPNVEHPQVIQIDAREQDCRRDDGWNDAIPAAASHFIQAGIDAREQAKAVKASSMAAQRRAWRMTRDDDGSR
jgi:hypothetical protein